MYSIYIYIMYVNLSLVQVYSDECKSTKLYEIVQENTIYRWWLKDWDRNDHTCQMTHPKTQPKRQRVNFDDHSSCLWCIFLNG